jgi:hypothetical protein
VVQLQEVVPRRGNLFKHTLFTPCTDIKEWEVSAAYKTFCDTEHELQRDSHLMEITQKVKFTQITSRSSGAICGDRCGYIRDRCCPFHVALQTLKEQ